MMKCFKLIIPVVFVLLTLQVGNVQAQSKTAKTDPTTVDRLFYDAKKEKMLGNDEKALKAFLNLTRFAPDNATVWYEVSLILEDLDRLAEARLAARKSVKLDPRNPWFIINLAALEQATGNFKQSVKLTEGLVKLAPDRIDYNFNLARAYQSANQDKKALKVYNNLEKLTGYSPEITNQKKQIYLRRNKLKDALKEVEWAIKQQPDEPYLKLELADIYQSNGNPSKAKDILVNALQEDPENGELHIALARIYRDLGDEKLSWLEMEYGFASTKLDPNAKLRILSMFANSMESDTTLKSKVLRLVDVMVKAHPENSLVLAYRAELYYKDHQLPEAETLLERSIMSDAANYSVWQLLFRTTLEVNNFKKLDSITSKALDLFPTQPLVFYLNGLSKIQLKNFKGAIEVLKNGVKINIDQDAMLAEMYANIGESYFRLKNNSASDSAFDMSVKIDPKNSSTLNNYSYYLSLRGDSLIKAEKLALQANILSPENSYYQDTYGWIKFKQGDYISAKDWIGKAIANRQDASGVLFEHYGDVLFKLGDIGGAIDYWKKAQNVGGGSDLLSRKIEKKSYLE